MCLCIIKRRQKLDICITGSFESVELIDEFAPLKCHVMSLYEKTLLILSSPVVQFLPQQCPNNDSTREK